MAIMRASVSAVRSRSEMQEKKITSTDGENQLRPRRNPSTADAEGAVSSHQDLRVPLESVASGGKNPLRMLKMLFFRSLHDIKQYSGVSKKVSILHKAALEGPEPPAAWMSLVPLFSN